MLKNGILTENLTGSPMNFQERALLVGCGRSCLEADAGMIWKPLVKRFREPFSTLPGNPDRTDQETVSGKAFNPSRKGPGNRSQPCPETLTEQTRKPCR